MIATKLPKIRLRPKLWSRPESVRRRIGVILVPGVFLIFGGLTASTTAATKYAFTTLAGSALGGSADGTGPKARFHEPWGVAADGSGNIYVADSNNCTIRKITPSGVVSTLAGVAGIGGFSDGTGSDARFSAPSAIATDSTGNIYVADTGNYVIRKITPDGNVTTLAGSPGISGSADGQGPAATFNLPNGIAVNASGTVYVAEEFSYTIRKITADGEVTTFAGTAGHEGLVDGLGGAAEFERPSSVAVDGSGNVIVADGRIREITPDGMVTTLAPSGIPVAGGDVAADGLGNIFFTSDETIGRISSTGVVTTLAGTASVIGFADGTGSAAGFNLPAGLAVDPAGNVIVADRGNGTIRKITSDGVVTTIAGTAGGAGSDDGTGVLARFTGPWGVAVDGSGTIYVVDSGSQAIRKITSGGVVTTLAGMIGVQGPADGTGLAAQFNYPQGIAVDGTGSIYVADTSNSTIRKISPAGEVTTFAGTAYATGSADGTGAAARFNLPGSVAVDGLGNVYVSDTYNNTIRKISPAGEVTTLAGTAGSHGSADGTGGAAQFILPMGLAVDADGNVYVADYGNATIRKITPTGVVTTFAGAAGNAGSTDATGSAAQFFLPAALAFDGAGNLFVADYGTQTIREISPAGVVTTVAGIPGTIGATDGVGKAALFYEPSGIAVDGKGDIIVADSGNDTVRFGVPYHERADFNGDAQADILWSNTATGDRAIWYMNGTGIDSFGYLAGIPTEWKIVGTADFDGDGKNDILWEDTTTGDRSIWRMDGTTILDFPYLAYVDPVWHIAAVGDFNGDGKADVIWENTSTGDRAVWFLDGTGIDSFGYIAGIPTDWHIVGAADIDGDGQTDLIWENLVTGDRTVWFMNGSTLSSFGYIANIPGAWHIAMVADFDGDGHPDLLWENTTTGDRAIWLMNGTTQLSAPYLAYVDPVWSIVP